MRNDFLLRSPLIFPANNKKFIEKAIGSDADALIFDIEDAVLPRDKQEARDNTMDCLNTGRLKGRYVFIRINQYGTKDFVRDMEQLVHEDITGYLLTKVYTAEDIVFADKLCGMIETKMDWKHGKIRLTALIETGAAVANCYQIAHSSKRLCALFFGGEDFLDDTHSTYTMIEKSNIYARNVIIVASRSAGLLPIDTPYLGVHDIEGFIDEKKEMYKLGFAGSLILSPKQIEPANKCFSPSDEDIEYSRGLVDAIEKAKADNTGVVIYRGAMVGPPLRKRVDKILRQVELISKQKQKNEAGAE